MNLRLWLKHVDKQSIETVSYRENKSDSSFKKAPRGFFAWLYACLGSIRNEWRFILQGKSNVRIGQLLSNTLKR